MAEYYKDWIYSQYFDPSLMEQHNRSFTSAKVPVMQNTFIQQYKCVCMEALLMTSVRSEITGGEASVLKCAACSGDHMPPCTPDKHSLMHSSPQHSQFIFISHIGRGFVLIFFLTESPLIKQPCEWKRGPGSSLIIYRQSFIFPRSHGRTSDSSPPHTRLHQENLAPRSASLYYSIHKTSSVITPLAP